MKNLYLRNRLCIPVKGYNRSIIYDLNRGDYFFISNDLFALIHTEEIIDLEEDQKLAKEWKEFLLEEEIIFPVDSPEEKELFPGLNLDYNSPDLLTNIVIHDNIQVQALHFFSSLFIRNIAIITEDFNPTRLNRILESINKLEVDSISVYIKINSSDISEDEFKLLYFPQQILSVYTFSNERNSKKWIHKKFAKASLEELTCSFEEYISLMVPSKAKVNNHHFFESKNFHNYFNQKLYIDASGYLKNGLKNRQAFGNINAITKEQLLNVIQSVQFTRFWKVKKENTLVCQDCEFRNMCVDPREPTLGSNGQWYHETECNYNPFLSLWSSDAAYKGLIESGVTIKEGEILIDAKEIQKNFHAAWQDEYVPV